MINMYSLSTSYNMHKKNNNPSFGDRDIICEGRDICKDSTDCSVNSKGSSHEVFGKTLWETIKGIREIFPLIDPVHSTKVVRDGMKEDAEICVRQIDYAA